MAEEQAFQMQYKDDIQQRMTKEIEKVNSKATIEGSFGRDLVNANSVEFENAYAEMSLLVQAAYGTTAWGRYLTNIAGEFGVDRKQATPSVGEVTIIGSAGSYVPIRSLFSTKDGSVIFQTDSGVTLDAQGKATVKVTSTTTGSGTNVGAGTINHIPASIAGVSRVTNIAATHDGSDEETDDELRTRYLAYVREPATSGNVYHYKHWALSVAGVGDVKVIPLAKGPGTVRVLIIGPDKNSCSPETIQKVKDYIETVRPIGATVYVETPSYVTINVKATVYPIAADNGYAAKIQSAITNYFVQTGFTENSTVSIAQIGRIMLDTNTLLDYGDLTINDTKGNIKLSVDQLPRLGKLTLTVGS